MKEALKAPESNWKPLTPDMRGVKSYMKIATRHGSRGVIIGTTAKDVRSDVARAYADTFAPMIGIPCPDDPRFDMQSFPFMGDPKGMAEFEKSLPTKEEPVTKRVKIALMKTYKKMEGFTERYKDLETVIADFEPQMEPSLWSKLWSRFKRKEKSVQTQSTDKQNHA